MVFNLFSSSSTFFVSWLGLAWQYYHRQRWNASETLNSSRYMAAWLTSVHVMSFVYLASNSVERNEKWLKYSCVCMYVCMQSCECVVCLGLVGGLCFESIVNARNNHMFTVNKQEKRLPSNWVFINGLRLMLMLAI